MIDEVYAEREHNLQHEIQKQYAALYDFEERTRKLEQFSQSLESLVSEKERTMSILEQLENLNYVQVENTAGSSTIDSIRPYDRTYFMPVLNILDQANELRDRVEHSAGKAEDLFKEQ